MPDASTLPAAAAATFAPGARSDAWTDLNAATHFGLRLLASDLRNPIAMLINLFSPLLVLGLFRMVGRPEDLPFLFPGMVCFTVMLFGAWPAQRVTLWFQQGIFQRLACAVAYPVVGDVHLAEDAAQEAFVTGTFAGVTPVAIGSVLSQRATPLAPGAMGFASEMLCGGGVFQMPADISVMHDGELREQFDYIICDSPAGIERGADDEGGNLFFAGRHAGGRPAGCPGAGRKRHGRPPLLPRRSRPARRGR